MNWLPTYSNLPNLHPALVHFPIALLGMAFVVDLLDLIFRRQEWLKKAATLIYAAGAMAAALTFWSGRRAADSLDLPATAQKALAEHENLALYTLIFFCVFAVIRLAAHLSGGLERRRWIHPVMVCTVVAGQFLMISTADHGGALVYRHGVAVSLPKTETPVVHTSEPAAAGPTLQDGGMQWIFGPQSEKRLSEFFQLQPSVSFPARTEVANDKTALTLRVSSHQPIVLLFNKPFGDVQIEVELDAGSFNGVISLLHHVGENEKDYFSASIDGGCTLGRVQQGTVQSFAKESCSIVQPLALKAVAADRHFRGYVNGKLVVHGHASAAAPGKVGLQLEGAGSVRITRISITPLSEDAA